jgi:hypothetical protein
MIKTGTTHGARLWRDTSTSDHQWGFPPFARSMEVIQLASPRHGQTVAIGDRRTFIQILSCSNLIGTGCFSKETKTGLITNGNQAGTENQYTVNIQIPNRVRFWNSIFCQ